MYTENFIDSMLEKVNSTNANLVQIAKENRIDVSTLRRWIRQKNAATMKKAILNDCSKSTEYELKSKSS